MTGKMRDRDRSLSGTFEAVRFETGTFELERFEAKRLIIPAPIIGMINKT
jgi:hypothetical protein